MSESPSFTSIPVNVYPPMVLEGFFCGVYSGIFALYLQCHGSHASTEGTSITKKIIFYALCVLYVFSVVVFVLDVVAYTSPHLSVRYALNIAQPVVFGCCDFIAQSILIYRCWIVWDRKIRVVIIPSILTLAYLVMWLAADSTLVIIGDRIKTAVWSAHVTIISVAISMVVNALVTGLIVCRIFMVSRGVQGLTEKSLRITGERKLRSLIFVIIESGMVLFSIQLVRVILSLPPFTIKSLIYILGTHQMVNGITPTFILVRVLMGLSFDDKEEATESLRFASNGPTLNSISEMGSISCQEWKDNNFDGSEDIQAIESNGGDILK